MTKQEAVQTLFINIIKLYNPEKVDTVVKAHEVLIRALSQITCSANNNTSNLSGNTCSIATTKNDNKIPIGIKPISRYRRVGKNPILYVEQSGSTVVLSEQGEILIFKTSPVSKKIFGKVIVWFENRFSVHTVIKQIKTQDIFLKLLKEGSYLSKLVKAREK